MSCFCLFAINLNLISWRFKWSKQTLKNVPLILKKLVIHDIFIGQNMYWLNKRNDRQINLKWQQPLIATLNWSRHSDKRFHNSFLYNSNDVI